jgi:hypothetical protein
MSPMDTSVLRSVRTEDVGDLQVRSSHERWQRRSLRLRCCFTAQCLFLPSGSRSSGLVTSSSVLLATCE